MLIERFFIRFKFFLKRMKIELEGKIRTTFFQPSLSKSFVEIERANFLELAVMSLFSTDLTPSAAGDGAGGGAYKLIQF